MTPYEQLLFCISFGGYWFRLNDKNKMKTLLHILQNIVLYANVIYEIIELYIEGNLQDLLTGKFLYLPVSIFELINHIILFCLRDEYDRMLSTLQEIFAKDLEDRRKFQQSYNYLRWGIIAYAIPQFLLWFISFFAVLLKEIIAVIFRLEEFFFVPPMPIENIIGLEEGRLHNWLKLICSFLYGTAWLSSYTSIMMGTFHFLAFTIIEFRIFRYQLEVYHKNTLVGNFERTMKSIVEKQCLLARLFENLKNTSSLFLGLQNSMMALNICFLLHTSTKITNAFAWYIGIYGFVGFIMIITATCYFGDLLEDEGDAVNDLLYDLPWYTLPPKQRRYFALALVQGRRSLKISYKGILPTNLETYLQFMQAVYSYIMLLNSV